MTPAAPFCVVLLPSPGGWACPRYTKWRNKLTSLLRASLGPKTVLIANT